MEKLKTRRAAAGSSREKPLMKIPNSICFLSELDHKISATELLVQLSDGESNGSNSTEENHGKSRATSPPPSEDEDEEGRMRLWRRKKRFRSISDLYESTEPLIVAKETKRKRRKTSRSVQKKHKKSNQVVA
ncbi:hypothetical protein Pyn_21736 [Prunus yedoensis var. nudiflora]|uniref:Uncharacterized protein n=1 Tax=Prunus yedoensis var. nudiflora TaxID=2094558 RepID=A0A314ZIW6_PRUYE|nr:hypothetical protein Pyn_21736 [Prunus yedoensis var. nudiflora]